MIDLLRSPFAVLGVSEYDNCHTIAEAAEQAILEGRASEHDAHEAQRTLMASRPRLSAEVSWLLGATPTRAQEAITALRAGKGIKSSFDLLKNLQGGARANLAAHLCNCGIEDGAVIRAVLDSQDSMTPGLVLESVNNSRTVAGFPSVSEDLAADALRQLRRKHCEAVLKSITSTKHPGKAMTSLVEDFLTTSGPVSALLAEISDAYDSWSSQKLGAISRDIDGLVDSLKHDSSSSGSVEDIKSQLALWDEYSQPQQLIFESRGLDEPRSREIYDKVRSLSIWLANEEQKFTAALDLSEALLQTFPELPSVVAQLKLDVETLGRLVAQARTEEGIEKLRQVIEQIQGNPSAFRSSIDKGELRCDREQTLAGRLHDEFISALKASAGTPNAELPWMIVRGLAIDLHNEHGYADAIVTFLNWLLAVKTVPPLLPQMRKLLSDDLATVRRNAQGKKLSDALERKDLDAALSLVGQVLNTTVEPMERQELSQTKSMIEALLKKRNSRRTKWAVWGGIAAVITIWIAVSDDSGSPGSSSPSPTSGRLSRNSYSSVPGSANQMSNSLQAPTSSKHQQELKQQIEHGKRHAEDLESQILRVQGEMDDIETNLQRHKREVDSYKLQAQEGTLADEAGYQGAVDSYNQLIPNYNRLLEKAKGLHANYEAEVDEVNRLVDEYNSSLGGSVGGGVSNAGTSVGAASARQSTPSSTSPSTTTKAGSPALKPGTDKLKTEMPPYSGERLAYTVQSGDTLSKIADHFGMSAERLLAFNESIKSPDQIFTGEVVLVPGVGETPPQREQSTPNPNKLYGPLVPVATLSSRKNSTREIYAELGSAPTSDPADRYTIGSNKTDVLRLQGTPTNVSKYSSLGTETWSYGISSVDIGMRDGRVIEWKNTGGNLKVVLNPGRNTTGASSFTIGSHKDDVLRLQGTPTNISKYSSLGTETWSYGISSVDIGMRDGRVIEWKNTAGNLKVALTPGGNTTGASSFTIGSHKDDVLRLQGTPTNISKYSSLGTETWSYGISSVDIGMRDGRVIEWSNTGGNLKAR